MQQGDWLKSDITVIHLSTRVDYLIKKYLFLVIFKKFNYTTVLSAIIKIIGISTPQTDLWALECFLEPCFMFFLTIGGKKLLLLKCPSFYFKKKRRKKKIKISKYVSVCCQCTKYFCISIVCALHPAHQYKIPIKKWRHSFSPTI